MTVYKRHGPQSVALLRSWNGSHIEEAVASYYAIERPAQTKVECSSPVLNAGTPVVEFATSSDIFSHGEHFVSTTSPSGAELKVVEEVLHSRWKEMFDGVKSPPIDSHLFLVPDEPTTHFVAHVIGSLYRIVGCIRALAKSSRIITNIGTPIPRADISARTVVSGVVVKILPIFGKPTSSWKVISSIFCRGRSCVADVAEVCVFVIPAGWVLSTGAICCTCSSDVVQYSIISTSFDYI